MFRARLLSGTTLSVLLLTFPGQAMAACAPAIPTNGQVVTCTGADTTGISGAADNVAVTINPNASITTSGTNAINLGFNSTITSNASSTISSNLTAINIVGGIVYANGTITGGNGTAINFGASNGNFNIYSTSNITGNVIAGSTADQFRLRSGGGTLNVSEIGTKYIGFDQFYKNDAGTWLLTGSGNQAWSVLAGTLQGDTTSMAGNLAISSGAVAAFSQSSDGTHSGLISGAGSITKSGSGILILRGANTYTGGTTVTGGTVNVIAENNLGAAAGNLRLDGGTLQFGTGFTSSRRIILQGNGTIDTNGFNSTINGIISGTSTLTKTGTGTLILGGVNTYSGGTVVSAGTLQGTTSSLQGNIANAGNLIFHQNNNGTYSGIISGSGYVTKSRSGTVSLRGANTYTGGTLISNGALDIVDDNNLGAVSGALAMDGGTLRQSADIISSRAITLGISDGTIDTQNFNGDYSGAITGIGSLTKTGAGNLILTGMNSYSGGTIISAGALIGNTNSLQRGIVNNSALIFDQNFDGLYSSIISGNGTLTKEGTGSLTLSGLNTFSGATYVNNGRLIVNGALAGPVTVGASSTLQGNGTTGSLTADGKIAPGNSIGTLTSTGAVTFNSGSVYEVEVDSSGNSDRLIASGALTINGGTVDVRAAAGNYAANTSYANILQGASRTGFFDTVTTDLAFLTPTLSYTATGVDLLLTRNSADFDSIAQDEIQAGVANGVESLGQGNDLYHAFAGLSTSDAAVALDTLSGEHNAGITTSTIQSIASVRSLVSDRFHGMNLRSGDDQTSPQNIKPAAGDEEVKTDRYFWTQAFGTSGHSDSDGTAPSQNRESGGVLFGADAKLSDDFYIGMLGGWERAEIYTDTQFANSDVDSWYLGLYANRFLLPRWRLSGSLIASYHQIDTTRHIEFTGFSETPKGETEGFTISPSIETGYALPFDAVNIEPYAGLSLTTSRINSYTEKDGGSANLDVDSSERFNLSHVLGTRLNKTIDVSENYSVDLNSHFGWIHTYGDLSETEEMRFTGSSLPFGVKGASLTRDAAVYGVGVNLNMLESENMLYLDYTGSSSKDMNDNALMLGLRVKF